MAKSEEMKLEELKRLLRRLDKAIPPAPTASQSTRDFTLPPLRDGPEAHPLIMQPLVLSALQPFGPSASHLPVEAHPPVAAEVPASTSATLRTVLLAAGVSAAVSLSIIALVLYRNGAPRPAMLPEAPLALLAGAGEAGRGTDLGSIPPVATPVPEEAKPDAAAPKDVEAHEAQEVHQAVAAAPAHGAPMEAATPRETGSAETASTGRAEPPPEQAAPKEAVSEDISTPHTGSAASSTDGQVLAALDATQFLRRGLNMLASGNVNAAQLLLQRSAELGNGEAAYALATTYDGAPGAPRSGPAVRPNSDLAWRWYERAQELGVAGARKRLDELKRGPSSSG